MTGSFHWVTEEDARLPEDRGTALTVASLREGVRQEWEETQNAWV